MNQQGSILDPFGNSDRARKRGNVSSSYNNNNKKQDDYGYDLIGQDPTAPPASGAGITWKGILIIIILVFATAILGLLIWHIVHSHSNIDAILACVNQIKNVQFFLLKGCLDMILGCVNQIKDIDLPAIKSCLEYIKYTLGIFINNQQAIVDDYRCNDFNPCTTDIFQFGGCMHKWKKCHFSVKKDGKQVPVEKNGCSPIGCNDVCHDPPYKKKDQSSVGTNPLQLKTVNHNGLCGIGGVCKPNTPCKGQCTPFKKKDGTYAEEKNILRGADVLKNPFQGCPVLPFKIAANPICQCRKESACVYRTRFNMGVNPSGPLDICDNKHYLKETCLSAFNPTTYQEKALLNCLKVTTSCQPGQMEKKTGLGVVVKEGTNFLQCMYHFSCSEIDGDLQPISPPTTTAPATPPP